MTRDLNKRDKRLRVCGRPFKCLASSSFRRKNRFLQSVVQKPFGVRCVEAVKRSVSVARLAGTVVIAALGCLKTCNSRINPSLCCSITFYCVQEGKQHVCLRQTALERSNRQSLTLPCPCVSFPTLVPQFGKASSYTAKEPFASIIRPYLSSKNNLLGEQSTRPKNKTKKPKKFRSTLLPCRSLDSVAVVQTTRESR